uniref:Microcystin degrading enzyme MlrB n=1 Tax=Sphingomonas sp. ACM-3962 TaxID=171102 RepID=A0A141R8A3_9SPHN|nr:microcystin degrading enzyme MlrB [Sphingomonas sp. ACM-3962]
MTATKLFLALTAAIPMATPQVDSRVLDAVFADIKPDEPGCAYAVDLRGKVLFQGGFGLADLTTREPITPATRFELASTSKQFTAALILILAQERRLRLTASIRTYLPDLPKVYEPVSVADLLHHTSGIREYFDAFRARGEDESKSHSREEVLAFIKAQRGLDGPPGHRFSYVNTNYFLLAEIVERLIRKPFPDGARELLFIPAGMKETRATLDTTSLLAGDAHGYQVTKDGKFAEAVWAWQGYGDRGVRTTVGDLAVWHGASLAATTGGQALEVARLANGKLRSGRPVDYAGGLFVDDRQSERVVSHSGLVVGNRAMDVMFPDSGLGISVMCNRDDISPAERARKIALLVKPGAPDSAFDRAIDPAEMKRLGRIGDLRSAPDGYYRDPLYGQYLIVDHRGGEPIVSYNMRAEKVTRRQDGIYRARRGILLSYAVAQGGPKRVVQWTESGPISYEYVGIGAPEAKLFWPGQYHSDELGITVTLSRDTKGWSLDTPAGAVPLAAALEDDLVGPNAAFSLHAVGPQIFTFHTVNLNGIVFRRLR